MYKPIKFKTIKFQLGLDSDRDGVPDWKDCQPFNPYRQEEELIPELKEGYGKAKKKLKKETQEKLEPIEEKVGPWVEEAEGLEEKLKEKMKGIGETVKEKYEGTTFAKGREYKKALEVGEKAYKELPMYLLVKIKGDKWYNWGEVPAESITMARMKLKEIIRHPNIEHAKLTKDPTELKKLNFGMTKQKIGAAGKQIKEYAESRKFGESIKAGMQIRPEGRAAMTRFAEGPSGRPPRTPWQPRLPGREQTMYPSEEQYQRPPEQYGYSQRSPHYQEQSAFGPGVVPYRPIGRQQVTAPHRPVSFPMQPSSRPHGMVVGAQVRQLQYKPVMFNFLKIGYRRR